MISIWSISESGNEWKRVVGRRRSAFDRSKCSVSMTPWISLSPFQITPARSSIKSNQIKSIQLHEKEMNGITIAVEEKSFRGIQKNLQILKRQKLGGGGGGVHRPILKKMQEAFVRSRVCNWDSKWPTGNLNEQIQNYKSLIAVSNSFFLVILFLVHVFTGIVLLPL